MSNVFEKLCGTKRESHQICSRKRRCACVFFVFECVGLLREVRLPVCHVCVGGCVGMRVGEQMCGFDVE